MYPLVLILGEQEVARSLARRLESLDYALVAQIIEVREDPLALISYKPPDLLCVVDELLPDEYGDAFIKSVRQVAPDLPILQYNTGAYRLPTVFPRIGTAEIADLRSRGYLADVRISNTCSDREIAAFIRRLL